MCKKTVEVRENNLFLPFCSMRCKMVDFWKWLDGKYVIPDDFVRPMPDNQKKD